MVTQSAVECVHNATNAPSSSMKPQIIVYIFELLFLAYYFKWDIPQSVRKVLFGVVAGYPNYIESAYQDFTNDSFLSYVVDTNDEKKIIFREGIASQIPWTCDPFHGRINECSTTITPTNCAPNTQFSYEHWTSLSNETQCFKNGKEILCAKPIVTNNICMNVVSVIELRKTSTFLTLEDEYIGENILQTVRNVTMKGDDDDDDIECYSTNDIVELQGHIRSIKADSAGKCESGTMELTYGINSSSFCILDISMKNCSDLRQQLLSWWKNEGSISLCNCGKCEVPFLEADVPFDLVSNSTECYLPLKSEYIFTFNRGSINGAINKLVWSSIKSSFVVVEKKYSFLPLKSTLPLSRFESKRGRFHCPADVGCWQNFLYIFGSVNELSWNHQIILLVIAMLVTMIISKRKSHIIEMERKFPFKYCSLSNRSYRN